MAVSTAHVCRSGPFDHTGAALSSREEGALPLPPLRACLPHPHHPFAPARHKLTGCPNRPVLPAIAPAAVAKARERYAEFRSNCRELLVSGSDDFTMFLWDPKVRSRDPCAWPPGLVLTLSALPAGAMVAGVEEADYSDAGPPADCEPPRLLP